MLENDHLLLTWKTWPSDIIHRATRSKKEVDGLLNHGKAIAYTITPNFLSKFTDLYSHTSVPKSTFSQLLKIFVSRCFQAQYFATCENLHLWMFSRTIFFSRRSRRVSKERPKTATLPHPQVLDETLKDKVAILDLVAGIRAQRVPDTCPLPNISFDHWPEHQVYPKYLE